MQWGVIIPEYRRDTIPIQELERDVFSPLQRIERIHAIQSRPGYRIVPRGKYKPRTNQATPEPDGLGRFIDIVI